MLLTFLCNVLAIRSLLWKMTIGIMIKHPRRSNNLPLQPVIKSYHNTKRKNSFNTIHFHSATPRSSSRPNKSDASWRKTPKRPSVDLEKQQEKRADRTGPKFLSLFTTHIKLESKFYLFYKIMQYKITFLLKMNCTILLSYPLIFKSYFYHNNHNCTKKLDFSKSMTKTNLLFLFDFAFYGRGATASLLLLL